MDCPSTRNVSAMQCANHGPAAAGPIGWGVLDRRAPPAWVFVMQPCQVSHLVSVRRLRAAHIVASRATWSAVRPGEISCYRLWCQVFDPWLHMRIHVLSRTLRLAEVNPCVIDVLLPWREPLRSGTTGAETWRISPSAAGSLRQDSESRPK